MATEQGKGMTLFECSGNKGGGRISAMHLLFSIYSPTYATSVEDVHHLATVPVKGVIILACMSVW